VNLRPRFRQCAELIQRRRKTRRFRRRIRLRGNYSYAGTNCREHRRPSGISSHLSRTYIFVHRGEKRGEEEARKTSGCRESAMDSGLCRTESPPQIQGTRFKKRGNTNRCVFFRRRPPPPPPPPPLISRYATSFARSFKARRAARRCQFSGNYHRAYPRRDQRNSRVNNARGPRSGEGEGEGGGSRQNCAHGKGELSTGQRHRELART
jgi:hypothetical protein